MAGFGKGMAPLSSQTVRQKKEYIALRADRLKWTVSKYVTAMVDLWFALGCPPVDSMEAHLPEIPFREDAKHPTPADEAARLLFKPHPQQTATVAPFGAPSPAAHTPSRSVPSQKPTARE